MRTRKERPTGRCLIRYTLDNRTIDRMFATDDVDFATKEVYRMTNGKAVVTNATVVTTSKVYALG